MIFFCVFDRKCGGCGHFGAKMDGFEWELAVLEVLGIGRENAASRES
jgi:hypothetical protein